MVLLKVEMSCSLTVCLMDDISLAIRMRVSLMIRLISWHLMVDEWRMLTVIHFSGDKLKCPVEVCFWMLH